MNKVLFSHSYFLRLDPKQWDAGQPYPPLGTLFAAAFLREHCFPVSLFDTMFVEDPDRVIEVLEREKPRYFVVYDDGFNYLTKMCLTNMRHAAWRMIRAAWERDCTVIVSSSDSTDHYKEYLAQGADFVLLGEGEQTLLQLLQALERGASEHELMQTDGLSFLQNGTPVRTQPRKVMRQLDDLPLPAWDLVDIESYRKVWLGAHGYFSINISTTRGCPFKCNWCAKPIYGNRYNARSPQHVVRELKQLKEQFHFDHIWFSDDIFGLKPGWVNEFADLVETEGLRFRFKIQARVDLLLQENYIRALARAGCDNVWMGAESGSQKVLDAMDKGITVEQIYAVTPLLKKFGIRPSFFIQFGYSGETREDITSTFRMIHDLLPDSIGVSVSYPLPGTGFYEKVKADLIDKANWTDSDEMMVMFRSTYSPAFYKQLHRYVHKAFHTWQAAAQLRQLLSHPGRINRSSLRKAVSIAWWGPSALLAKEKLRRLERASGEPAQADFEREAAEAFSHNAPAYNRWSDSNTIFEYKRERVRHHTLQYLVPGSSILELNAGTGEDAVYFARQGHYVHATDLADGMLEEIKNKVSRHGLADHITQEQCSFNALEQLHRRGPYDLVFSNLGGLNCTPALDKTLQSLHSLLKPGGKLTLVIIPGFCLWEMLFAFKGQFKMAFRRLFRSRNGAKAHLDGRYFRCWYYSPSYVRRALGAGYELLSIEGLCSLIPPAYVEGFAERHPRLYAYLRRKEDKWKEKWPWRSIGDYYIISFRKRSEAVA